MQLLFPKKNLMKYGIPEFIAETWLLSNFQLYAQQRAINLTGANPVCEGLKISKLCSQKDRFVKYVYHRYNRW